MVCADGSAERICIDFKMMYQHEGVEFVYDERTVTQYREPPILMRPRKSWLDTHRLSPDSPTEIRRVVAISVLLSTDELECPQKSFYLDEFANLEDSGENFHY